LGLVALSAPAAVYMHTGFPSRFGFLTLSQDELNAERARYWSLVGTKQTSFASVSGQKNVVLVGNSHAYDLSYALTKNGFSGNLLLIATGGVCYNFGHDPVNPSAKEECAGNRRSVLTNAELPRASAVYLHDSWAGVDVDGLLDMVRKIRERTPAPIVIFGPKMIFSDSSINIRRAAAAVRMQRPEDVNAFAQTYAHGYLFRVDRDLANVVLGWHLPGVSYVSSLAAQCGDARQCDVLSPTGAYLYFDNNHFTLEGSTAFGARLKALHPELF